MANILDSIFEIKSIRKLFDRTNSVLGVDIGSSAIKVVQLSTKSGKAVLENYAELALGPYAGLEVGQATNLSKIKIKEAV